MYSIKEIENCLFHVPCLFSEKERKALYCDKRKGVQKLLAKWEKAEKRKKDLKEKYEKMSTYEQILREHGSSCIAGIDEAGRGPIAGPVIAAAVILKEGAYLPGLNDSKQLTKNKREVFFQEIMSSSEAVGIGFVAVDEIDRINIYQAANHAMVEAVRALKVVPDHLLIDAMELPLSISQTSLIKGDCRSISIAAASVIAKVTRDRVMREIDQKYPQYGFARHFGYATAEHLQKIKHHGICREHRRSFAPVKDVVS